VSTISERIQRDIKADKFYEQQFANDGERFLAWYLRNVFLRTREQARAEITDGQNDKEIDAIVIDDEQRRIVVLQGKFYGVTVVDAGPLQEILAAWAQIKNLPRLEESANERLRMKLLEIDEALKEDYEVEFELVTTGSLTAAAEADLASFQETLAGFEHPACTLTLVDEATLVTRLAEAESRDLPELQHRVQLEAGKYLSLQMVGYKTVVAAVPIAECLKLPGVKDGRLFRRNVRQALGQNKVNRGLKTTLTGDQAPYFFLYHNGITALCRELTLDPANHTLDLRDLAVVNGCQSLTTMMQNALKVKDAAAAYVLFRFYEIPQRDVADRISTFTNSQSAVKPRDLRSNDKRELSLKKAFEQTYPDGYLITKRGEVAPADRDQDKVVDVAALAKAFVSWHCQRPNIAFNDHKLFDKYFDQLFHADYPPADVLVLQRWMAAIDLAWRNGTLGLNPELLSVPAYARSHLLFAVSALVTRASAQQSDMVPSPLSTAHLLDQADTYLPIAAGCFNGALEAALSEYKDKGKILSPGNWLKSKDSVLKVTNTINMWLAMSPGMLGGAEMKKKLVVAPDRFGARWSAE
jgi:hypothetical protein